MADAKKHLFSRQVEPDVHVVLRVEDVLNLRPDWNEVTAAEFLRLCGKHLAVQMLAAGTLEIVRLMQACDAAEKGDADA